MSNGYICHSCGGQEVSVFYEVKNVPVHSVLLMPTREEALRYPKRDILLGFCRTCGFISNLVFDPEVHEYSSRYEETQGFSSTFNTFHLRLATQLIDKYNLRNKDIIEIGCGKGEFLNMLCELGGNRGIGFDPSYISERDENRAEHRATFIKDFYSEKYANYRGDFICCKMTLEHIQETGNFIKTIRRSVGGRQETIVFFQVPDVTRILRELAFWDVYYEHCSYFSLGSLTRLFETCGFEVIELSTDYDDQYLLIAARPSKQKDITYLREEEDLKELASDVAFFSENYRQRINRWRHDLQQFKQSGQRVIIWGGGSKGVSFLTTLGIQSEIEFVVDINPHKHGTYMAGSGHKILGPQDLSWHKPDIVIVMNPVYHEEIRQDLRQMGLNPRLIDVQS